MVGDPGFFGSLFRAAKGGVRGFIGGGPIGAITGSARGFRARPTTPRAIPTRSFQPPNVFRTGRPGVVPVIQKAFGFKPPTITIDAETGEAMPKRRRMNVGNAKALRRAIRRTDGFVRLSRSALKNTGFKIVSKSSGKVSRATMDKAVAAAHHRG